MAGHFNLVKVNKPIRLEGLITQFALLPAGMKLGNNYNYYYNLVTGPQLLHCTGVNSLWSHYDSPLNVKNAMLPPVHQNSFRKTFPCLVTP